MDEGERLVMAEARWLHKIASDIMYMTSVDNDILASQFNDEAHHCAMWCCDAKLNTV